MQILRRHFADEKRRSTTTTCCFSSVNLLLVVAFLGNRLQETDASQQTSTSVHRQQRSSLPLEPYDNLTEDEKRSVVTIEYNIQHINSSSSRSNFLVSVYRKTREVIVSQLNKQTPSTADAAADATTTTDCENTSALASTTTTTTPPKTIPIITIIVTLPSPAAHRRRRRRRNEEVTYKEDDLYFVKYDPEILELDLRISVFIRRKDVSLRTQKLHQVVNSTEFRSILQTEVQAPVVRIYQGIPSNVSTRNSSVRPSSDICSLWISAFLYIIHNLRSVDMLNTR